MTHREPRILPSSSALALVVAFGAVLGLACDAPDALGERDAPGGPDTPETECPSVCECDDGGDDGGEAACPTWDPNCHEPCPVGVPDCHEPCPVGVPNCHEPCPSTDPNCHEPCPSTDPNCHEPCPSTDPNCHDPGCTYPASAWLPDSGVPVPGAAWEGLETRLCGQAWAELLVVGAADDEWRSLAREWIAASLNVSAGAAPSPAVAAALTVADGYLRDCAIARDEYDPALAIGGLLAAFNAGTTGVTCEPPPAPLPEPQ
jgi:hypothetical protein